MAHNWVIDFNGGQIDLSDETVRHAKKMLKVWVWAMYGNEKRKVQLWYEHLYVFAIIIGISSRQEFHRMILWLLMNDYIEDFVYERGDDKKVRYFQLSKKTLDNINLWVKGFGNGAK